MIPDVIDTVAELKDRPFSTGDEDLVFCSTVGGYLDHFSLRRRYYEVRREDAAALAEAVGPKAGNPPPRNPVIS